MIDMSKVIISGTHKHCEVEGWSSLHCSFLMVAICPQSPYSLGTVLIQWDEFKL